ncbi:MAG TPA: SMP-30/gluconolactonase/LRE family protein [Polyangiaceae bacterium]|jgi:D-xylonolactonase
MSERNWTANVEAVANYHCRTGENPLWNERDGCLYWEDIDSGRLFRINHETLKHECFYQGDVIGGFTFQEDGSLLLFETNRVATLDAKGQRRVLLDGVDSDMRRFNDVIADPEGRVFAGTIGKDEQAGGLYRVDLDGTVTSLWKGTGCANGMGFTPDLRHFYWTCSTTRRIYIADYDRARGALENRTVFYQADASEGTPDGLAVDATGTLWSARWGGSAMLQISADAKLLERIPFPVTRISSAAFGGPTLDTLYVTTAGGQVTDDAQDGALYRIKTPGRGTPEFRSRVLL